MPKSDESWTAQAVGTRSEEEGAPLHKPTRHNLPAGDNLDTSGTSFASSETKAVFWLKVLLLSILVASTIGVALLVYYYTSQAEKSQFEERFDKEASKMVDAVRGSFFLSLGALDAYVLDLVSYAKYSDSDWPFVTLPDYGVRAAKIRSLSKAFFFAQNHLVTNATRDRWEAYSLQNDMWTDEVLEVQLGDANYHGVHVSNYTPYGKIYYHDGSRPSQGPGPFLPSWSCYPLVPIYPPYNWDALTFSPVVSVFDEIFEERQVVIRVSNLPDLDNADSVHEVEIYNDWAKDYIRETNDESEPVIDVYYPISTESLDSVTQPSDPAPGSVVGILYAAIYWRELIQDILPPGTGGITAVFEINDHTFTYAIDGPNTTFLGRGDLHDTNYDYLEHSALFFDVESPTQRDRSYTGLPLNQDARKSRIRIYPSAELEANFVSNDPVIYTVIAVLTFAFTSALFIIYDRLHNKTLKKMTHTAVQSTANVHVLEARVKERTRELETTNRKLEEANRHVVRASEAQLKHFACMSHEIRTPLVRLDNDLHTAANLSRHLF